MSDMFIDENTHSYLSPKQVKGGIGNMRYKEKRNLPVCVKHK